MKTEDVLLLDCRKVENKKKLNRFLFNIKPIAKRMGEDKTKEVPLHILEETLHGICLKYGHRTQGIMTHYLNSNDETKGLEFSFYSVSCMNKQKEWIGTVHGKTLWEVLAKVLVKIFADIKKGQ